MYFYNKSSGMENLNQDRLEQMWQKFKEKTLDTANEVYGTIHRNRKKNGG